MTLISEPVFEKLNENMQEAPDHLKTLMCYSGNVIQTIGTCSLLLEDPSTELSAEAEVYWVGISSVPYN